MEPNEDEDGLAEPAEVQQFMQELGEHDPRWLMLLLLLCLCQVVLICELQLRLFSAFICFKENNFCVLHVVTWLLILSTKRVPLASCKEQAMQKLKP